MVEPLISQLMKIDESGRIDLIAAQHGRRSMAHHAIVVRAENKRMVGPRVISIMLREVIQGARFAGGEVAGCREHRNVDVCELFAERDHLLPVPVVAGVIQPADEQRIRLSVQPS